MMPIDRNQYLIEDGTLTLYLRDIAKHTPLPAREEAQIARRIRKGDKRAVEKLVKANLRFVVSVSRNYQNQGMPLSDLINEGNLGLIRAAYRFDEKKNFKFISYAVWWIRQAILQGLADHSRIVKVPLNQVATIHKVGKVRAKLEQKYRRLPNDREVADVLDLKENEVTNTMKISNRHTSLDAPVLDNNTGTLVEMICYNNQDSPDYETVNNSTNQEIEKVLGILSSRERKVIRMYFGINEETNYTLEDIGQQANITRERVRQIKNAALRKLRHSGRCQRLFKLSMQ